MEKYRNGSSTDWLQHPLIHHCLELRPRRSSLVETPRRSSLVAEYLTTLMELCETTKDGLLRRRRAKVLTLDHWS